MGDLVMLRPRSNAAPHREAQQRPEGAQIVFFTGVRYERFEPPAPRETRTRTPPKGGLSGAGRGKRKRRA
jgi:hypothetical protein